MKVLVADDEVIARTMLAAMVQKAGHTAIRASNGQRAWQLLEDNPDIGLVVTDVAMPELAGDELLRLIRASRDHGKVPVIIVTGLTQPSEHARFREMGANEVLTKPISADAVAQAIGVALARPSAAPVAADREKKVFDRGELLERVGGDDEVLKDVIAAYHSEGRVMRDDLERAVAAGDQERAVTAVHKLKGALLNLGAARAGLLAREVEAAFRARKGNDAMVAALGQSLDELAGALAK